MPKIMVSLRSVFIKKSDIFSTKNEKSASGYNYIPCFFLLIKSIEFLNFRHFAILGIYWGNLIVSQKDLAI